MTDSEKLNAIADALERQVWPRGTLSIGREAIADFRRIAAALPLLEEALDMFIFEIKADPSAVMFFDLRDVEKARDALAALRKGRET